MVVIIDGNQLACRCYFSLIKNNSVLTTKAGKRTELIYGFLNSFRKIIRTYKDSNFMLTWDGGNKKRQSIYPLYKSGRKKFEDAFYEQLVDLRTIISFIGIPQYHFKDVEADDLIGTLTIKSRKKGQKVLIISSDHDFEQLISKHVTVLHPLGNNIIKDVQFVLDNYGVLPNRLLEVMAITGDPTDAIPGIEGVGDKTAAKLILANGCLDNILKYPDDLKTMNRKGEIVDAKDKLKLKVKENLENIKLAYRLAEIDCDMEIEPVFEREKHDYGKLKENFERLEFNEFITKFETWCF